MSHATSPAGLSSMPYMALMRPEAPALGARASSGYPLLDDEPWLRGELRLPEVPERHTGALLSPPSSVVGLEPALATPQGRTPERGEERWGTVVEREACHRMQSGLAVQRPFVLPAPAQHLEATRSPTGQFVYFLVDDPRGPGKRLARINLRDTSGPALVPPRAAAPARGLDVLSLAHDLSDLPPYQLDDNTPLAAPIELTRVALSDATEPDAVLLGATFMQDEADSEPWPSCLIVGQPDPWWGSWRMPLSQRALGPPLRVTWRCLQRDSRFAPPQLLGTFSCPWILASKEPLLDCDEVTPSELFLLISSDAGPALANAKRGLALLNGVYGFVRHGSQLMSVQPRQAQRAHFGPGDLLDPVADLTSLVPLAAQRLWAQSLSDAGRTVALGYDDRLIVYRLSGGQRPRLKVLVHQSVATTMNTQLFVLDDMHITSLHLSRAGDLLLANGAGLEKLRDGTLRELRHGVCLSLGASNLPIRALGHPRIAPVYETQPRDSMRRNRQLGWLRDGAEVAIYQPHQISVMEFSRSELMHSAPPKAYAFYPPLVVRSRSAVLATPPEFMGEMFALGWKRAFCIVGHAGQVFQIPVVGTSCESTRTHMTLERGADIWMGDHRRRAEFIVNPRSLKRIAHCEPFSRRFDDLAIERLWGDSDGSRLYTQLRCKQRGNRRAWQCLLTWDFAPQRAQAEIFRPNDGYMYPIESFCLEPGVVSLAAHAERQAVSDDAPLVPFGVLRLHSATDSDPVRAVFGGSNIAHLFEDLTFAQDTQDA